MRVNVRVSGFVPVRYITLGKSFIHVVHECVSVYVCMSVYPWYVLCPERLIRDGGGGGGFNGGVRLRSGGEVGLVGSGRWAGG